MSGDYTVTLDIRNSAQTEPGWTNVTERGRGNAEITIDLIADSSDYKMQDVAFADDPEEQLSKKNLDDLKVVIKDQNDKLESNAYYSITITDKKANCTLVCDPRVSNTN